MIELELKNLVEINNKTYLISTISMKIRHTFFENDKDKIVYETMVFEMMNGELDYTKPLYNERYSTREEAIYEHGKIVQNPKVLFLNQKCKI
ncbi:MAG: hypothetical protein ACK5LP_06190 [Campylobacteraceae bacterium]